MIRQMLVVTLCLWTMMKEGSESAEVCELKPRLRDRWFFLGQSKRAYIRMRRTSVMFKLDKTQRIRYKCLEKRGNIYLLRKMKYEEDKDGILCVGFSYIADHPDAEYSLSRLMAPGIGSHLLSPRLIDRGSVVTINNTCELSGGGRLQYKFIRRRKTGCKFPAKLRGDWNFTYRHAQQLTIARKNMTLILLNGETTVFNCETRDGNLFLVRSRSYRGSNKDAVLCFRMTPLPKDPFYDFELSRLNSGEALDGQLMLVPRERRLFLHQDCDWLDSPARPNFLYPL